MTKLNAAWHKKHPMPMHSTLAQRVTWHASHAKACGCRELPPSILAELKARRIDHSTKRR